MITGDVCRAGVSGGLQFVRKNYVYRFTWLRMVEGRVVDRALMNYMLLPI